MTKPQKEKCSYPIPAQTIESAILTLRGQKVVLDADLARIYGVATKVLNQAVKRDADRFPADFLFRLVPQEVADMANKETSKEDVSESSIRVAARSSDIECSYLCEPHQEITAIVSLPVSFRYGI